jgi:quaternary ammonium compound-resistance protein SugE
MVWLILVAAGLLEVAWAVCLKQAQGFTRPWPSIGFVVASIASVVLLAFALKKLPLGTAYAIWTGIGAVGTAVVGIVALGEPADPRRIACIALIVAGIVGLRLATPG